MMNPNTRVLVVDQVQKCAAESAYNGADAIRKLRDTTPDVIVVEQNIQGGGIRFAELVGMNPNYARVPVILTSTRPSPETIIQVKNAGISSYLAKPFRPSELLRRIESAMATPLPGVEKAPSADEVPTAEVAQAEPQDEGAGGDIASRVSQIDGLPPFPATHAELLKLTKSDTASGEDLAEKIQMDPSFLATVLKLANSSCYGLSKKTTSLTMAVTRLGMEEISNLVMAAQVFKNLGDYEDGGGLDTEGFWKHSVGTAFAAKALAKKLSTEAEGAFLAGMLHDLGKVVLDRFFAEYYKSVTSLVAEDENVSIIEAEQDLLGVTHAKVGGQLAEAWKFADNFLNCIVHHHDPSQVRRYQRLVCVVHMADAICRDLKYGNGGDETVPDIDEKVLDRFNIGSRGVGTLKEAVAKDLADADSFLAGLAG
jgi:putative nucleotidyltransferase with HDIG domain